MDDAVFWNTSHKRLRERTGDPLGFDALREAMADALVPFLTGATRHADDYLWVLVGLRWARASSEIDADVWENFRRFERGLKQYWHKFTTRRDYLGKRIVSKLCERERPNVEQRILEDERATGLLGNYIASLRAMGLVDATALAPTKPGEQLIRRVTFDATPRTFTSWPKLRNEFAHADRLVRASRMALGKHLFANERMRHAATALLVRPRATSWTAVASALKAEQRRIAASCAAVLAAEETMINAFCELITGRGALARSERSRIQKVAAQARRMDPIPATWNAQPIAKAIAGTWRTCSSGQRVEKRLLDLHVEVVQKVRGNEPWIEALGDLSLVQYAPVFSGRDFRFANLGRLLRETKWDVHAA